MTNVNVNGIQSYGNIIKKKKKKITQFVTFESFQWIWKFFAGFLQLFVYFMYFKNDFV